MFITARTINDAQYRNTSPMNTRTSVGACPSPTYLSTTFSNGDLTRCAGRRGTLSRRLSCAAWIFLCVFIPNVRPSLTSYRGRSQRRGDFRVVRPTREALKSGGKRARLLTLFCQKLSLLVLQQQRSTLSPLTPPQPATRSSGTRS